MGYIDVFYALAKAVVAECLARNFHQTWITCIQLSLAVVVKEWGFNLTTAPCGCNVTW